MRKIYFPLFTVLFVAIATISSQAQTVFITTGTAGTPAYNAGPVYRSSAASAFDASRYCYLYTAAELNAAGITSGATISLVGWVKNNTATSLGVGGIFRIYMKNTTTADFSLPTETWANLNTGATLVYENLTQVIPATANPDYIDFPLTTNFVYTGGSLEIATEWDINQVAGNASTGTFDWLWSTVVDRIYGTGNTTLAPITTLSSTTNSISTIDNRRPFIKITYSGGTTGIDVGAQSLVAPVVAPNNCYTSAEPVTIQIRNFSINPIDFSINPVTVTTNVTGAVTQTLTGIVNTGVLAPASTLNVPMSGTLNMNATGVYTFNATAVVTGDVTPANNAMTPVNITKAVLATGTISANPGSYCVTGGTPTLSTAGATGYSNLQWQQSTTTGSGFIDIPGATTTPYTVSSPITQTMYYRLQASCNGNTVTSGEATVTLNNPQITGTTPGASCGPGPVTVSLAATGTGSVLSWYAAPSGGVPIGTGSPFTTPPISANTTFYVSTSNGGGITQLGLPAEIAGTSGAGTTNFGLVFDAFAPFVLKSVVVYPISAAANTPGTVTIDVISSTGAVLNTATVNVVGNPVATATPQTVILNFNVSAGTNLKLRPGSRSASITGLLFEPSATAPPGGNYGYPFVIPGVVSINHSTLTAAPLNTPRLDLYYYFYNWEVITGCESPRTPVLASVTTPPSATISYAGSPYCSNAGTATVTQTGTAGGTYSSTPGLTINPTTGSVTLGTSTPGTYTVTYTIAASGGCPQFTTTASITINTCGGSTSDLSITKTDGVTTYTPGGTTTYTIVVSNNGPDASVGATVIDNFPVAITSVAWTASYSGGATGPASGVGNINATINLPVGSTATFTAVSNISPSASGILVNTATVVVPATDIDPTPGNNTATDTDIASTGPVITVNGTLTAFTTCAGTPSSEQTFTVSGTNLIANLVITAPAGFEISTTSGSGFSGTISLTPVGGNVNTTTIYVRLSAAATGTPSGNITVASTGATTQNVAVSGTVNPTPNAIATPSSQTVCTGAAITPIVLSGAVSGTTFNWTRNNLTVTGIAASGSGNISGTLTNTTSAPVTVTFTITPTANSCVGSAITATVVVNPTPSVNTVANQAVCNGALTTAVTFSGPVAGTVYNWVNNTPSIGLAASGSGNISPFTATNATTAPVVATITVTPSYTNAGTTCTGTARTFTITVNPTPTVNAITNQSICRGAATTAINFNGAVTGTVFNWTNNTTSIGLAASGSGNIASFTAINNGTTPVTATITVTPSYTNAGVTCTGTPITFTITVNPAPTVTCPANVVVNAVAGNCSAVVIYPPATATGSPAPVINYSTPSGSTFPVGVTTVTVTATNTCGTATCTFTVTVVDAQLPVITTQPANSSVCVGGSATFSVVATNAASYQWQQFNGTVFANIPGATAANYTVTNATFSMNTNTYRVVVTGLCSGTVTSNHATLVVNPLPVIGLSASPAPELLPTQTTTLTATTVPSGGTYVWFLNGAVIPGATGPVLGGLGVDDAGVYRVVYTDPNGCTSTSADLELNSSPSDNLYVYPSPNNGQFQVRFFNQPDERVTVNIYDEKGTRIYNRSFTTTLAYSSLNVDISNISTGVYLVEAVNAAGRRIGAKWIVVRR